MSSAFEAIRNMEWADWVRGVVGAIISGGAGAVGGGIGAITADAQHFNLQSGKGDVFHVMWIAFLVSGIISLAKFLQGHPLPDAVTVTEVRHTETSVAGSAPVIQHEITETTTSPSVKSVE